MKILDALIAALKFVLDKRATIKALQDHIAEQDASLAAKDQTIADLQAAIDANKSNDEALIQAAADARAAQDAAQAKEKDAEDKLAAEVAANTEADAKADELLSAINEDTNIPISVSADGVVTPS